MNRIETVLVNNPLRAACQRHLEAGRLLRMGGPMNGGRALEMGCGRGVGAEIILDRFGADRVDGFDLDPAMIARARRRLAGRPVRLWVGDAASVAAPDAVYDAVFDFGIIHHVVDWRRAVSEAGRVLKPGGTFYGEEALDRFIANPVMRLLLEHPREDRFDRKGFQDELEGNGLKLRGAKQLGSYLGWFVVVKEST